MTNCTHSFCSDNPPNIVCRKCGKQAYCDTRVKKTIFGYSKYGRKRHYFVKGWCIHCGMNQFKIAVYREVLA